MRSSRSALLSVHKNDALRETVLGLLLETPLTVKEYRKSIAPEETMLALPCLNL